MADFLLPIIERINNTGMPQQIREVDVAGLFTNIHFMVPFVAFVCYKLYRQAFVSLILLGLVVGLWIFSGSIFMQDMIVDGKIQLAKVLPVLTVFMAALAVAIYFLFMRSD